LVLTRAEKEELVKQLYKEDKTIREIAKVAHMSFTDIAAIIRKETGEGNKNDNNKPTMTKETEVLKLFKKGKTPVEVAIISGISSDETEDLYLGYLRLKNLHHLVSIYKELKYNLPSFIRLFKHLRGAGIREEGAADLIRDAKQIPFLRNTFMDLTNANTNLEERNKGMLSELTSMQNEVDRQQGYLQWYIEEQKRVNFEVEQRKRELQYLDQLINDKTKEYFRYK
jgi:AraC-like DNA-binding protein